MAQVGEGKRALRKCARDASDNIEMKIGDLANDVDRFSKNQSVEVGRRKSEQSRGTEGL
jgi:hypothetical protein